MQYSSLQLRQIASICDKLSENELDECVYMDNPEDATVINSEIEVKTRETGRLLGHIIMGTGSDYRFKPPGEG